MKIRNLKKRNGLGLIGVLGLVALLCSCDVTEQISNTENSEEILLDSQVQQLGHPPTLKVLCNGELHQAMISGSTWTVDKGNGSSETTIADSPGYTELMKLSNNQLRMIVPKAGNFSLEFDTEPLAYSIHILSQGGDSVSTLEPEKFFVYNLEDGFVAYKVVAQWEEGEADYYFYLRTDWIDESISENLHIEELTEGIYIHKSEMDVEGYGSVSANGLLVDVGEGYVMIDTPWTKEQTRRLIDYVELLFGKEVEAFIPTHSHDDNIGGALEVSAAGAEIYSFWMTAAAVQAKIGRPVDQLILGVTDLQIGDVELEVYYPGIGHSEDNIVVYFPQDKLLFGGCLISYSEHINIADKSADQVGAWRVSVNNVKRRFYEAEQVIPGHGRVGNMEMVGEMSDRLGLIYDEMVEGIKDFVSVELISQPFDRNGVFGSDAESFYALTEMQLDLQGMIDFHEPVIKELSDKRVWDRWFLQVVDTYYETITGTVFFIGNMDQWDTLVGEYRGIGELVAMLNHLLTSSNIDEVQALNIDASQIAVMVWMKDNHLLFAGEEGSLYLVPDREAIAHMMGLELDQALEDYLGLMNEMNTITTEGYLTISYEAYAVLLAEMEAYINTYANRIYAEEIFNIYASHIINLGGYYGISVEENRNKMVETLKNQAVDSRTYEVISAWNEHLLAVGEPMYDVDFNLELLNRVLDLMPLE